MYKFNISIEAPPSAACFLLVGSLLQSLQKDNKEACLQECVKNICQLHSPGETCVYDKITELVKNVVDCVPIKKDESTEQKKGDALSVMRNFLLLGDWIKKHGEKPEEKKEPVQSTPKEVPKTSDMIKSVLTTLMEAGVFHFEEKQPPAQSTPEEPKKDNNEDVMNKIPFTFAMEDGCLRCTKTEETGQDTPVEPSKKEDALSFMHTALLLSECLKKHGEKKPEEKEPTQGTPGEVPKKNQEETIKSIFTALMEAGGLPIEKEPTQSTPGETPKKNQDTEMVKSVFTALMEAGGLDPSLKGAIEKGVDIGAKLCNSL